MKASRILTWVLVLGLLGSSWYAIEGSLRYQRQAELYQGHVGKLAQAVAMAARHPSLFEEGDRSAGEGSLKNLVKNIAREKGLEIAFLSENEKEAGKGKRERQVTARLVRAPHEKLVRFLAELEELGSGAKVKELHLRPSKETTDTYQDAEVIFAKVFSVPRREP